MSYRFGTKSQAALAECHPLARSLANHALALSICDFSVTSGEGRTLTLAPYPADPSLPGRLWTVADAAWEASSAAGVQLIEVTVSIIGGCVRATIAEPAEGLSPASSQVAATEPVPTQAQALPDRAALSGLSEAELLARVIWGECRGKSAEEARAIAHVVMNRAAKPCWWGTDVKTVCLAPKQFSCLNQGDPNLPKILEGDFRDGSWGTCLAEAAAAVSGESLDPTNGATSYHATAMRPYPAWAKAMTVTATIGSHVFYRAGRP